MAARLPRPAARPRTAWRAVLLGAILLVGAGIGAALWSRGAGPAILPEMIATTGPEGAPLWVQARETTITEWNRCHAAGACALELRRPARAKPGEDWPATGLNFRDIRAYLDWINAGGRHHFRLPTAAEWAALAAPVLPETPDPIFTDPSLTWASTYLTENLVDRRLRPSKSWARTDEGIWDLNGNVWEWTQDCYAGADPQSPAPDRASCPAFVVGGEHEAVIPYLVRDPARGGCAVGAPPPHLGMRLVSDSAP